MPREPPRARSRLPAGPQLRRPLRAQVLAARGQPVLPRRPHQDVQLPGQPSIQRLLRERLDDLRRLPRPALAEVPRHLRRGSSRGASRTGSAPAATPARRSTRRRTRTIPRARRAASAPRATCRSCRSRPSERSCASHAPTTRSRSRARCSTRRSASRTRARSATPTERRRAAGADRRLVGADQAASRGGRRDDRGRDGDAARPGRAPAAATGRPARDRAVRGAGVVLAALPRRSTAGSSPTSRRCSRSSRAAATSTCPRWRSRACTSRRATTPRVHALLAGALRDLGPRDRAVRLRWASALNTLAVARVRAGDQGVPPLVRDKIREVLPLGKQDRLWGGGRGVTSSRSVRHRWVARPPARQVCASAVGAVDGRGHGVRRAACRSPKPDRSSTAPRRSTIARGGS